MTTTFRTVAMFILLSYENISYVIYSDIDDTSVSYSRHSVLLNSITSSLKRYIFLKILLSYITSRPLD